MSEEDERKRGGGGGVSRRDLFTFWRRKPAEQPAPEPEPEPPPPPPPLPAYDPLRPPGAIDELLFPDKCARCGKCVEVCPRGAIFALPDDYGASAGTPAIIPRDAPCVVCDDLACTRACPSGALMQVAVFDIQMGTAIVDDGRCVTFSGTACTICTDACPVPGALTLDPDGHPLVEPARCIGCGICENLCPTDPAAILVEPSRELTR